VRADLSLKHLALVIAATVLPLLPFLDKAFHIDDPLFIWTAKQILKGPLDFYGFTGNWFGLETPAYAFIKNPPLASYYIAVVGLFAGFSEKAIHIAFLVPAAFASAGATGSDGLSGCRSVIAASLEHRRRGAARRAATGMPSANGG